MDLASSSRGWLAEDELALREGAAELSIDAHLVDEQMTLVLVQNNPHSAIKLPSKTRLDMVFDNDFEVMNCFNAGPGNHVLAARPYKRRRPYGIRMILAGAAALEVLK